MKLVRILLSLSILSFLAACGGKEKDSVKSAEESASKAWEETRDSVASGTDELKQHADKVGDKIKTWGYDQKEDAMEAYGKFVAKAEQELKTLQAQSLQLSGEARTEWDAGLKKASEGKAALAKAWADAKDASADSWEAVEKNLSKALAETQAGLSEMKEAVSKKK